MIAVLLASLLASVTRISVLPSDTDPGITEFNSPHSVFIDSAAKSRNQLLVFLPGTNGKTGNTNAFCETAAETGYQVINLMYPDTTSAATVHDDKDRNAFLNFRVAVIEGRDVSTYIHVNRANSIENRLIKLLQYLDKSRPGEHWGRFLAADGQPDWPKIAVSGLSQGAGHAALLAVQHRVARAICFGGPKDFDRATRSPAAWYTPPATPLDLIFTFNHEQDRQGCTFVEQMENCRALGLEKFGPRVSVDSVASPFKGSHILTTNYPVSPMTSIRAHTSVVADGASPKASDGTRLFKPVWLFMLRAGGS